MLLQIALFHSFLWLSNIPLHIYMCVYTPNHTQQIFIHSPINGHFGFFHVLVTVYNAAMNIKYYTLEKQK